MQTIAADRRTCSRRSSRGGGRRVIDPPVDSTSVPTCPICRKAGVALLAGEAEGGWWFVCLACDYLWDQRQIVSPTLSDPRVLPRDEVHVLDSPDSAAGPARLSATVRVWSKMFFRSQRQTP